jgi:hypothetical protein
MPLLSLQEESSKANIDYEHKSKLFFKFGKAKRVASCLLDHPSDLLFQLTQRKVFTDVYSVQFKA